MMSRTVIGAGAAILALSAAPASAGCGFLGLQPCAPRATLTVVPANRPAAAPARPAAPAVVAQPRLAPAAGTQQPLLRPNAGSGLISDRVGSLISDRGGSVISDHGLGLTGARR